MLLKFVSQMLDKFVIFLVDKFQNNFLLYKNIHLFRTSRAPGYILLSLIMGSENPTRWRKTKRGSMRKTCCHCNFVVVPVRD